jgi:amino-acid N-acetyltransferase
MTVTDHSPGASDTEFVTSEDVVVRQAQFNDAETLFRLITDNVDSGHLLPRALGELQLHIPRFLVAATPTRVVACAELGRLSPRVAEIRSLVVEQAYRGQGLGTRLLTRMIETAGRQGYPRLCAFAHDPRAFIRLGFSIVPHRWIRDKITTDCYGCVWFRRCEQYAVLLDRGGLTALTGRHQANTA